MDTSAFAALGPAELRAVLPGFLAAYVSPEAADGARNAAAAVVVHMDDAACRAVVDLLTRVATDVRIWDAQPGARDVARAYIGSLVLTPRVDGLHHVDDALAMGPVVLVCNHLSYVDTTVTDYVLAHAGRSDLAARLFAAAGPKVYQDLFRRVAAICLNTLPVPQSGHLGHAEKLPPRDLVRWVQQSLDATAERLAVGGSLVIYPEGARTRTGRMGSFLRGVHRYLAVAPGTRVVPMAISGTERLMPLGVERLHHAACRVRFGASLSVEPGGSREALAQAHTAVSDLLPEPLRPAEETPPLV